MSEARSDAFKGHVLVLDDDDMVGATLGLIAEGAGYEATVTVAFDEFWSILTTKSPTHVTVDLNMPGVDGIEVLRQLAERGFRGSVVVSSGLERRVLDAARRSAEEHGLFIAGVLPKPFRSAELVELLERRPPTRFGAGGGLGAGVSEAELREALDRRSITIALQPKVLCASGAVVGFEALARWTDPQRGPIPPIEFVAVAERTGLIADLTDQVLDQALAWLAEYDPDGATHVAVNLSARLLTDLRLTDRVEEACRRRGVPSQRLLLELTETASSDDPSMALDVLTRFRIKGIPISLDDFGTGHSTLVQLTRQPFSELKIDQQFVRDLATSAESQAIVRATVALAHGLGMTSTAEGVEDAASLAVLEEIGCDLAQGYYVARPMPGDAVRAWATARAERGGPPADTP